MPIVFHGRNDFWIKPDAAGYFCHFLIHEAASSEMGAKEMLLLAPSKPCRLGMAGEAQPRTVPVMK